jgi:hypothetical protein
LDPASWSATRARTFQDCRRRYYYRYLLAPRARKPHPPPEAVQAGRVQHLIGVEAWAGEVVHTVLRAVLDRWRSGRELSEAEAEALIARLLSRQFRDSQAYWTAHPDEYPYRPALLDLHYFQEGSLDRERARRIREVVTGSAAAFLRSDLAREIRAAGPRAWLPIDRNASARLGGDLLILVKPDFAFRDGARLQILDWKTGKPDPFWETIQLTCYALYAREKWGCALEETRPRIVHLHPELRVTEAVPDEETLRDVTLYIRESQEAMQALAAADELPPPERFSLAEDERLCRWCPFRGMCEGACRIG